MSAGWMLQALVAGALLGLAALAAERVAGWLGVPRRPVWAAAMLGSLLLPALSLLAPGLLPDPGIFPAAAPPLPAVDAAVLPLAPHGPAASVDGGLSAAAAWWSDPAVLLGLGWLTASLATAGVVAWTYRRLRAARDHGVPVELDGGEVRVTARVGPAVVGLLHPAVVVPGWVLDAPAEDRRLVLLHEREHVAAGDAWLLFLGTLALAAMPWSAPLWWQHRRLRAAVETDCDARVLARGASRRAYGHVLIRTAGCTPGLPLLGPAWGDSTSQLERRIEAMTARRPSHPLLRSLPLLALAAAVATTACDVAAGAEADASLSVEPASVRVAVEARLGAAADTLPPPRALPPLPPPAPAAPLPPLPDDPAPPVPPAPDRSVPPPPEAPPAPPAPLLPGTPAPAARPSVAAPPALLAPAAPAARPAPAGPPALLAPAARPAPGTPPALLGRAAPAPRAVPGARPAPPALLAPATPPAPGARTVPGARPVQPTASVGWYLAPASAAARAGADVRTTGFRAVSRLKVGSGAWRAGVRDGDQVIAVDGHDGRYDGSVFRLYFREPGSRYVLRIRRGGVEREVVAELDPVAKGGPAYY